MPKAHQKSTSSDEDEGYGYINPGEAKAHVNALEDVMTKIKNKIEQKETTDLLDKVLAELKEVLSNLTAIDAIGRHIHGIQGYPRQTLQLSTTQI